MDQHSSRRPLDLEQLPQNDLSLDTTFSELDKLIEPRLDEKLNFFGCPFDHTVISKQDLHPRLKTLIDEIMRTKELARTNTFFKALYLGAIAVPAPTYYIVLAGWLVGSLGVSLKHLKQESTPEASERHAAVEQAYPGPEFNTSENRQREFQKIKKNSDPTRLLALPYRAASDLTRSLGDAIIDIEANGERPFLTDDCDELLRNYDCGIVDNVGNIVLIKSPNGRNAAHSSGIEGLIKTLQYRHPFQRAMFELE